MTLSSRLVHDAVLTLFIVCAVQFDPVYAVNSTSDEDAASEESMIEQQAAREREASADEDPLAKREEQKLERPKEVIEEPGGLRFYGSVRIRGRTAEGEGLLDDDGSRAGAYWQSETDGGGSWFARAEAGFNVFSEFRYWLYPDGQAESADSTLFTRLAYVGRETRNSIFVAGKNWSTYYQVASFTDRLDGTGGDASGAFNAGTDGGAAGTGRADNVLQSRFQTGPLFERFGLKPVKLNAQVQYGNAIPGVGGERYGWGLGLSTVIRSKKDLAFGLAYNYSQLATPDSPALAATGIDGDTQALLLGVRRFGEKWYLGTTVSVTRNLHTTDQGIYFDGIGWELFGDFRIAEKVWLVTGLNYLTPNSGESQAGQFNIRYGILGLRYSLRELQRTAYAEYQVNDGHEANGTRVGNVFTLGVRWDFP